MHTSIIGSLLLFTNLKVCSYLSGRREGVEKAKEEILSAAEKVSKVRQLRSQHGKNPYDTTIEFDENSIQLKVHVPINAVGLLIGPKGARIKEIADITRTYIKTPCKHKAPIFELFGSPENVAEAKALILGCVTEFMNADQMKRYMKQLPIHEAGAPVTPPEVLPGLPFPSKCNSAVLPNTLRKDAAYTTLRTNGAPRVMLPSAKPNYSHHNTTYLSPNFADMSDELRKIHPYIPTMSPCEMDQ